MKKLSLILFIAMFAHISYGQFKFGVVGSYSTSISSKSSIVLGNQLGRKTMELGFLDGQSSPSIGLALRKDFGYLYVDGQVNYRRNAYTMTIQNFQNIDAPMAYLEEKTSMINMPITGGLKFGKVRLGLGPIFNYTLNHGDADFSQYGIEKIDRNLQMGFLFNLGYDINNTFTINARYENTFNKIGDDFRYNGKFLKLNSRVDYATINLGMYF